MPHLVIELTENTRLNCSQEELLDEANAALLASGQFQEAESLLLSAQRECERTDAGRATTIRPQTVRRVLECLAKLYRAWDEAEPSADRAARAAEWSERLAGLTAATAADDEAEP